MAFTLLKPDGIAVFEDPYIGGVIENTSYDQIYDEHTFLFSATSVKYLFEQYGMELIDLEPQETHGGSMRYILSRKGEYSVNDSVNENENYEKKLNLNNFYGLLEFKKKYKLLKQKN